MPKVAEGKVNAQAIGTRTVVNDGRHRIEDGVLCWCQCGSDVGVIGIGIGGADFVDFHSRSAGRLLARAHF